MAESTVIEDLSAVIPAYNAARHLPGVIDRVARFVARDRIVVVDDGSADDTRDVAGRSGATVVVHAVNQGKGAAIRSGLARAGELGQGFAIL
ncbi:MAG TPA: glycosyltransferase, partial [Candidatus Krumholzibacteria bacterium]|nr:glycosyltransferase [Candidatus Krumholzibacteria bacterium]